MKLTFAPVGQELEEALQAQRLVPRPSKVPPEIETLVAFSNLIRTSIEDFS